MLHHGSDRAPSLPIEGALVMELHFLRIEGFFPPKDQINVSLGGASQMHRLARYSVRAPCVNLRSEGRAAAGLPGRCGQQR